MQSSRVRFVVEMDLDLIPGWGHEPDDMEQLLNRAVCERIPHYNPTVEYVGYVTEAPAYMEQIETLARSIVGRIPA